MPSPVKPEFGPTLPQVVAPRLAALSPGARRLVRLAALGLGALLVAGLALFPWHRHYSHTGAVDFDLHYSRSLHRVTPDPGGFVKLEQDRRGRLVQSLAVNPVRLPAYRGLPGGELPLFAVGYIQRLAARHRDFRLISEGKTRVNTAPGYAVLYTARLGPRTLYGRDDLLVPDSPGRRDGVAIEMLATPEANVNGTTGLGSLGPVGAVVRGFNLGS
ncbi:MAG TPA: hypothetical protein VGN69_10845 [Solirubrobacteraceae bacterium]|jgi:hypothetical protein|nr:hypothetical protein [Solirubrobacteraceae bacterium]